MAEFMSGKLSENNKGYSILKKLIVNSKTKRREKIGK
jgi:hypothetical protein